MTAPTIYINELESAARFMQSELGAALNAILAGDYDTLEATVRRSVLCADAICESARRLQAPAPAMSQAMALMTSNASDEWYTPPWVLQLAREILGAIDLDPASSEQANVAVQATRFYTEAEDGYMKPWHGRVWLNPPFSDTARWARRLAAAYEDGDVTAALLLVNSAPGYTWYEELVDRWPAVQFRKRLAFVRGDGAPAGLAKKSQTLVYFGQEVERFFQLTAPYARRLVQAQEQTA